MIDFRYHIVSLIAVFLALGIGIVMGTTVVERAIVTRQEQLLDELNQKFRDERAAKTDVQGDLELWEKFGTEGAKFFVGGRLAGQSVNVLTAGGVPEDEVDAVVEMMRQAGAQVPAVVTMTNKWKLGEQTSRDQLALFTGAPEDADLQTLETHAVVNIAAKLGNAQPDPSQAAMVDPELAATLLGRLQEDGFIEIEGVDIQQGLDPDSLGGAGSLTVVVGGDDIVVPMEEVFVPLTVQLGRGGRTVATQRVEREQVYIDSVRARLDQVPTLSTVDNVNMLIGRYATVVALQQTLNGVYEQVGIGDGAQALLPSRAS